VGGPDLPGLWTVLVVVHRLGSWPAPDRPTRDARTVIRILAGAGALALIVGGDAPPAAVRSVAAGPPVAVVTYSAPVAGPLRVLRQFDPPTTPYGPGHRGVDLELTVLVVRSAAAGVVSFAGPVAGRGVVVVRHADGIATEYEPVRPAVAAGELVRSGQPIGRLEGGHTGCPSARCLHWGARRGAAYVDPLALLRPLGPVRLLPWPRDG
jgi:murein DD-endopeptidase MepM/ murein hydrolase activator NlpD